MRFVFVLLFAPLFSISQTVHTKDDRVFYEGKEKISGAVPSEIINRLQQALQTTIRNYETIDSSSGSLKAKGEFRLKTPHRVIRTVSYTIEVKPTADGFEYAIDSVSMTEIKRGFSTTKKSSKEMLEVMEDFGVQAENMERVLNEIDMRIQHLIVLLKQRIRNDATAAM